MVFKETENDEITTDIDILSPNKRNQTILHLCIQSNMLELFKIICSSKHVDKAKIFDILDNSKTTPLIRIFDEDFLIAVLLEYSEKIFCLETRKIVLWHICKKNFNKALHSVKESMPQDEFLKIIMLNDDEGEFVKSQKCKKATRVFKPI